MFVQPSYLVLLVYYRFAGGGSENVTIALCSSYFEIFNKQSLATAESIQLWSAETNLRRTQSMSCCYFMCTIMILYYVRC